MISTQRDQTEDPGGVQRYLHPVTQTGSNREPSRVRQTCPCYMNSHTHGHTCIYMCTLVFSLHVPVPR